MKQEGTFKDFLRWSIGNMSRNVGNCENGKFDEKKIKATGKNGGFGENGQADEMLLKVLTKVEDIMQMSCLKGPIESDG